MEETQEQVQEVAPEIKEVLKVSETKIREALAEIKEPAKAIFQEKIKAAVPGEMFDAIAANAVGVAVDAAYDLIVNQLVDKISKEV